MFGFALFLSGELKVNEICLGCSRITILKSVDFALIFECKFCIADKSSCLSVQVQSPPFICLDKRSFCQETS